MAFAVQNTPLSSRLQPIPEESEADSRAFQTLFEQYYNGLSVFIRKGTDVSFQLLNADCYAAWYCDTGSFSYNCKQAGETGILHQQDSLISTPGSRVFLCSNGDARGGIIIVFLKKERFWTDYLLRMHPTDELFRLLIQKRAQNAFVPLPPVSLAADNMLHTAAGNILSVELDHYDSAEPAVDAFAERLLVSYCRSYIKQYGSNELQDCPYVGCIYEHFEGVTLNDIAGQFHCHPNSVRYRLKQTTGKSFTRIVLEKRMVRASLLLENTPLSNEEVARISGFSDCRDFYRVFRRYFGITPGEYRTSTPENKNN